MLSLKESSVIHRSPDRFVELHKLQREMLREKHPDTISSIAYELSRRGFASQSPRNHKSSANRSLGKFVTRVNRHAKDGIWSLLNLGSLLANFPRQRFAESFEKTLVFRSFRYPTIDLALCPISCPQVLVTLRAGSAGRYIGITRGVVQK